MAERIHVVQVGAPDPELRNSPVVEETAEEYETAVQALPDEPQCYFNGRGYSQINGCAVARNCCAAVAAYGYRWDLATTPTCNRRRTRQPNQKAHSLVPKRHQKRHHMK